MEVSKLFGTHITEKPNTQQLFFGRALDQMGQNAHIWPKMPVLGQICPFLYQKSIFCKVITIFVNRAYHQYAWGYNFPFNSSQNISVSELWVISFSTKLGGTVRAIKQMTQKDNGPGPGRNYGETGVFMFGRKVVFGLKMGFTPKNHPK